ncbi:hypothetical protein HZY83_02995 [Gemella sp. GH3]|uniref:alginate O-acetyltransferase AlgX-related protein n=1 Tax=unclassified Gemella TaxID=2624949 RepID=UPI0015CFB94A|nr:MULTISPECIES: hypothetical protein [unclassified Gemella]MBF0713647.1 hypothetical protein [Gemella sp. GH3.1]NYS50599.1 hypothetical protein [Gemella sp. GH3]
MRKFKIIFITIFSIILFIPILFLNWNKDVVSSMDNRKLTDFPSMNKFSNETIGQALKFIDDRIYGREYLINKDTELNDKLFDLMIHPIYTYGQDGYIFFGMEERKYTDYHKEFANTIVTLKDYVESRGAKFYVVINPEKTSVYTRYLPKGVNYNRYFITNIEKELVANNVKFVDNTDLLTEKSYTEKVYNKEYDAGHWNDLGAFYGLNNAIRLMQNDFPDMDNLTLDDFDISYEKKFSLAVSKFKIDDTVPVFSLKETNFTDLTEDYISNVKVDSQNNMFSYIQNNTDNAKNLDKGLVFQGSYLNGRLQYLQNVFSDYIVVHNYHNIFNMDYYFNMFKPNIVVFEVAEYTLNDTYFLYEKMKNINFNPSINSIESFELGNKKLDYKEEKNSKITTLTVYNLGDVQYAYILSNGEVFDLIKEDNVYKLSTERELSSNIEVIYKEKDSNNYYKNFFKIS